METCRLTSYADLEWALHQVRSGRSVLVVVPRPHGSRRAIVRHLDKMQQYMAEARHEAVVSAVRHAQVRRYRPRRYVSQFTLSPAKRPAPTPPTDPAAQIDLSAEQAGALNPASR